MRTWAILRHSRMASRSAADWAFHLDCFWLLAAALGSADCFCLLFFRPPLSPGWGFSVPLATAIASARMSADENALRLDWNT
jgi:hypothetical protein